MQSAFPLTQVDQVVRRTLISASAVGVLGIVAAITLSVPLVAPGIVIGLGMAVLNHRIFQTSAMRFTTDEGTVQRRPFAGSVLARLGGCTAVALGLLVVVEPMGWGVIGSLALFQAMLLINAIMALLRYQREGISDDA